ncbi:PQQ-binding-like beta-propeller repeat protein [Sulfobacillus thermotolerans]|uniref:outer membrane protein assembly factor BamB family protein n=1 Tax=Sulfobacillus thermotolerans TaxID=338644 RepID=UPI003367B392
MTCSSFLPSVSTSHNGVIYVSDTATSTLFAINAKTGAVLWHSAIPNVLSAGAGRGAPTYADGIIWIATAQNINAFNARTGDLLSSYHVGGRFGIVNPVIAGGTMYIDNSYDWIMAIPLKKIVPQIRL